MEARTLELAGGAVEYIDSGGEGPTVVLLHGALMDEQLWMPVVDRLSPRVRCVVPVLPMGAHRIPRPEGAQQSPRALGRLVGDLIRGLQLRDVTLVGNDTGGALAQLLLAEEPGIAQRLVLVSCDAFENFPPGLPGRTMALACALPGGLRIAMASLRRPSLRRLPMTFGWMTRRPIPAPIFDGWLDAFAADRRVRRDVRRMMRQVDRRQLVDAAERLRRFPGESLVVWAAEDRVMPPDHARQLSAVLRGCRIEWVADSYTLVPLDQPARLAAVIAEFAQRPSVTSAGATASSTSRRATRA